MTLDQYIAANLARPFAWGEHDCVLFAANWVRQSTGIDYLAGVPAWTSARTALRTVQSLGGLEAMLDVRFDRVVPSAAKNGSLSLVGRTLYLFYHEHIVAPGRNGLVFMERIYAPCAWQY